MIFQRTLKYLFLIIMSVSIPVIFIGCAGQDGKNGANGTSVVNGCTIDTGCHAEGSTLGKKVLEAKAQYETSVHKNGIEAEEFEGSDSFYANNSSCKKCHTHPGFLDSLAGVNSTTLETDPSPIGCFTCHAPHANGDFSLRVANGTAINMEVSSYSNLQYTHTTGSICVSCHRARTAYSTPATGASWTSTGPHHGPQSDMLLGYNGGTWSTDPAGVAVGGTYGTYNNSTHTTTTTAGCPICHMTLPTTGSSSFSLSPNVGGHSFRIKGEVHGAEKMNPTGCNNTTNGLGSGCHSTAITVGTFTGTQNGYLKDKDSYLVKSTWYTDFNTLLKKLADPANACDGLLKQAFAVAGGTADITVSATDASACETNSFTFPATSTNLTNLGKAAWNYKFVYIEDKSFGAHNTTFAKELIFDSCRALSFVKWGSGATADTDCGSTRP